MSRINTYTVYYDGVRIVRHYGQPKPWIVRVRARSIKQAYYLVGNHVPYPDPPLRGKVGIVSVDHSYGPVMLKQWPFTFPVDRVDTPW